MTLQRWGSPFAPYPRRAIMAADQLGSLDPPNEGGGKSRASPGASVRAPMRSQGAARRLVASSGSRVIPPLLDHATQHDAHAPGEPGRPVEQGSDAGPMPEPVGALSGSTEIIQVVA